MVNLKIRPYKKGDELQITPIDLMADWDSPGYENSFDRGYSLTIVDDNGKIQAIVNYFLLDESDNILYGWFLRDKDANPLFITKVKKIVKNFLQNDFIICTISKEGAMQYKMHKYLGFEAKRKIGGLVLWVSLIR